VDTRDQTLTKLTLLHDKYHPTHHRPASLRWNYSRTAVSISWNWWWRMVDDDDGDDFPSPEPRTDSRFALPMKNRRWRRLDIVKRDESFSLIFFSPNVNIWSLSWGWWRSRGPTRQGRALHPCGQQVGPLRLILSPIFFIYSKNILCGFSGNSENFYFCTKITPRQFC